MSPLSSTGPAPSWVRLVLVRPLKNVLGRMRSMDIVHYPANGTVDLADWVRQSL